MINVTHEAEALPSSEPVDSEEERLPRSIRRQLAEVSAPWQRAAIRRVYRRRAYALEVWKNDQIPALIGEGDPRKRRIVPLAPGNELAHIISALLDLLTVVPVVVVDERAPGGVFVVRLPLPEEAVLP